MGDWTIDAGESPTLGAGTTVVVGNVTVRGTLTVSGGTLELQAGGASFTPYLLVAGQGTLAMDNAALTAGPDPTSRLTLEAEPGARVTAVSTAVTRLAATTVANMSLVGAHLRGAVVQLLDVTVTDSDGGLGADEGALLDATNVTVRVSGRALALGPAAVAGLRGCLLEGSFALTDYLVVADRATLYAFDSLLTNASTPVLLLSASGNFSNVSVTRAGQSAVLLIGADFVMDGGLVAPRADGALGIEAYTSLVEVRAAFQNYSIGISAIGSSVAVRASSFASSNATPKGGFAGIYGFDSSFLVDNSTFNGTYLVTRVPGPNATLVDVLSCSNSAMWFVRGAVTVTSVDSTCYADHYHAEDVDSTIRGYAMAHGVLGADFHKGTVDASGLSGLNFTTGLSQGVFLTFSGVTGSVSQVTTSTNDVAVEVRDAATVTIDGLAHASPGIGVRVMTRAAPLIRNSTFTVHNSTGVLVLDGTPTVETSQFWITANLMETQGVNLSGGQPLVRDNVFHGAGILTFGLLAWAGDPVVSGNRFEDLWKGAVFYAPRFTLEGNTFERCSSGAEARENATGTMRGNAFVNMTEDGAGFGVRLYYAASVIEGNTFANVNYGIQYFWYTFDQPPTGRIAANVFDGVTWYAIEIWNASRPLLVDNNTILRAERGGIEAFFSQVVAAHNVIGDSIGYGFDLTGSNLTAIGGRLENLSEGIHANMSNVEVRYVTFLLDHLGMIVQDGAARVENASFQFNGIAAEFVTDEKVEVNDSLFVGNVHAVWAFRRAQVTVRDSNFIGTLGDIVMTDPQGLATANVSFTTRGELNGGRLLIRGALTSTAATLTLKSVRIQFLPMQAGEPGISIVGASELTIASVALANSSTPYFLEVEGSTGSLTQVAMRSVRASPWRPGQGPYIANSTLRLRDVALNESSSNLTFANSQVNATNVTVRDNNATGVVLVGSTFQGRVWAILDNARCGIEARGSSWVNGSNVSVRGNAGGSLCFQGSRGRIDHGDLASGPVDATLEAASDVLLVSTKVARALDVRDTSRLTVAWALEVFVAYPNAALLPAVAVSVLDAQGLAVVLHPATSGAVVGLSWLPQKVVTAGGIDTRSPYTVTASLGSSFASATVDLDQDRIVQLSLADTAPPAVQIDSPVEGDGYANGTVVFVFSARDTASGIKDLQFRFGAAAMTALDPTAGTYTITRTLVDGEHSFAVRATDFAGNALEVAVNFTVDMRPPLITVVAPRAPANVTKADSVTVQVAVEVDVVEVLIGGVVVPLSGGSASRTLQVPEGASSIAVQARDRVGNLANATVFVACDRTPPALDAGERAVSTVDPWVVIRGTTEPGATVIVAGSTVPSPNGSFEALVFVDPGVTVINVRSRDGLSNEVSLDVNVTRGVPQPSHVLDLVAQVAGAALVLAGVALAARALVREHGGPTRRKEGGSP